jgi:biofilm PGA synthesis N-glycosyltransferase PgaC
VSGVRVEREELGGFTQRARPAFGMRPTLRFTLAALATVAYVGTAVWVSHIWRGELEDAIGPVMAWVIPIFMAYIPGVVIGFLCFTLIFTRYQPPPLRPPEGPWPTGSWPPVTVIIAAYNEEDAIEWTVDQVAASMYPGALTVVLAGNNSSDLTAQLAQDAAQRHGLDYRRTFEPVAGQAPRAQHRARRRHDADRCDG